MHAKGGMPFGFVVAARWSEYLRAYFYWLRYLDNCAVPSTRPLKAVLTCVVGISMAPAGTMIVASVLCRYIGLRMSQVPGSFPRALGMMQSPHWPA